MICMAEEEQAPTYAEVAAASKTNTPNPDKDKAQDETNTGDLDAVKGGKKGNGKGKGVWSMLALWANGAPQERVSRVVKTTGR